MRQKLTKNCNFTCAGATLSHEMRVDRQKLKKKCDFTCAGATLSHEMRVDRQKLEEKLRFYLCWSNPFARNEGRCVKNCGKIAILLVLEQPFRTK